MTLLYFIPSHSVSSNTFLNAMSDQTHCSICRGHLKGGCIWCFECGTYMHVKCSGLASRSQHSPGFTCQSCQARRAADAAATSPSIQTPEESTIPPQPSDFWSHVNPETLTTLTKIYNEVVHWKAVFYTISRNKTGFKFTDTMNTVLSGTLDKPEKAEIAMIVSMIIPYLNLARSKDGNDGSNTKTIR